ncbi:DUF3618 domain-containing protein [Thermomonospora umbrina]|uniref:Uncharacterized protein DUF3618 n=1 Tax=Thermomonospora umbrina TaxID=111806 RepID=A0A3D9SFK8_9ACTN|nr:DUF3618 domain-containing protein [Thermomonospora umbrina]REE94718.1 uncharacterized protein DUF3618 [Thermomonospora umbrina]
MTTSGSNATSTAADIERTRAEIGETVEALAAKADVKARAQHKLGEVRDRFGARASGPAGRSGAAEMTPAARTSGAGLAALAAAVVAAWLWRRRRARRRSAWHRAAHVTRTRADALRSRTGARAKTAKSRAHARPSRHSMRG